MDQKIRIFMLIFALLISVSAQSPMDLTREQNVTFSDLDDIYDRIAENNETIIDSYVVIHEVHSMFAKQQILIFGSGLMLVAGMCVFNFLLWKWFIGFMRAQLGIFGMNKADLGLIIDYMKEKKAVVIAEKKKEHKGIIQRITGLFRRDKK